MYRTGWIHIIERRQLCCPLVCVCVLFLCFLLFLSPKEQTLKEPHCSIVKICFGNRFLHVCVIHIYHIVSTHTVSRVDLICMWLTFVALVISSVNGHVRKSCSESMFLNCTLLGNMGFGGNRRQICFWLKGRSIVIKHCKFTPSVFFLIQKGRLS